MDIDLTALRAAVAASPKGYTAFKTDQALALLDLAAVGQRVLTPGWLEDVWAEDPGRSNVEQADAIRAAAQEETA